MATIAEEISALRQRISSAYDVIDQKGGDVPAERTSWNLSASIDSIRVGDADPASIVPVRYLKSTGTQYIDTVRYFTSTNNGNENRLELDFQMDELEEDNNQRIIGVIESNSGPRYYQAGPNGSNFYVTWAQGNVINGMPFDTCRHQLVIDTRTNYIWLDGQLSTSY